MNNSGTSGSFCAEAEPSAPYLPEWNDLPNECREAMCKAAGWFTEDWHAGQCALDIYLELRKTLPAPVFPLFAPPRSSGRAA